MSPVVQAVSAALALPEASVRSPRPGELRADVEPGALPEAGRPRWWPARARASPRSSRPTSARGTGSTRSTRSGSCRATGPSSASRRRVDPAHPRFPSIAAKHPSANWFEREVMDTFGLVPDGHPNPTRVSLHDDWPDGEWALRKDFPDDREVPRVEGAFHPFRPVTGEGVFQVPVGPVHAGIIEPGHFRFGVAGEPVLYLAAAPVLRPQGHGEALRAAAAGATGSSSPSPSPATPRWATRSPSPTRSSGSPAASRRRARSTCASCSSSSSASTTTSRTSAPSPPTWRSPFPPRTPSSCASGSSRCRSGSSGRAS